MAYKYSTPATVMKDQPQLPDVSHGMGQQGKFDNNHRYFKKHGKRTSATETSTTDI